MTTTTSQQPYRIERAPEPYEGYIIVENETNIIYGEVTGGAQGDAFYISMYNAPEWSACYPTYVEMKAHINMAWMSAQHLRTPTGRMGARVGLTDGCLPKSAEFHFHAWVAARARGDNTDAHQSYQSMLAAVGGYEWLDKYTEEQSAHAPLVAAAAEAAERLDPYELEAYAAAVKANRIYRVQSGIGRWTSLDPHITDYINVLGYGEANYALRIRRVDDPDRPYQYKASVNRSQKGYKQAKVNRYFDSFAEAAQWCECKGLEEADNHADIITNA